MSGHTETPWEAQSIDGRKGARGERGKAYIIGANQGGLVAATLPWPTELDTGDFTRVRDNAAFIVQACNAYDSDQRIIAELRAMAASFRAFVVSANYGSHEYDGVLELIDATLAKAGAS